MLKSPIDLNFIPKEVAETPIKLSVPTRALSTFFNCREHQFEVNSPKFQVFEEKLLVTLSIWKR